MTVEITSMHILTPMKIEYKVDGKRFTSIANIDFITQDVFFDPNRALPPSEVLDEIDKIIAEKVKTAKSPSIPESVIDNARTSFKER